MATAGRPAVIGTRTVAAAVLALVLAGCHAGDGDRGAAADGRSADSGRGATVSAYCEKFAREYAGSNAADYREDSAQAAKTSDFMMHLSNLFQPPGSRFTAGYDCRFQARGADGRVHDVAVGLFLAETADFARHTQWKDLQIIPIEHVADEAGGRTGYGVFKYLEAP